MIIKKKKSLIQELITTYIGSLADYKLRTVPEKKVKNNKKIVSLIHIIFSGNVLYMIL